MKVANTINALSSRTLGRVEGPVAPVLWEIDHPADSAVMPLLACAGAESFFIPAGVALEQIAPIARSLAVAAKPRIVIGATAEELIARTRRKEIERIDALTPLRCWAVMIQAAEASQMKSGGPFHRVGNLRQQGRCELAFVEAMSLADAEWSIANSPAHAVSVPFGLTDPSAAYRLLAQGQEMGTAILARRPEHAAWDFVPAAHRDEITFVISYPQVSMLIEPFPRSREQAEAILGWLAQPMETAQREQIWAKFRQAVPEPEKLRGNHPPEFGS